MVDLRRAVPLGSVSRRNILLFATSLLVAVFTLFTLSPIAHAADASWQGSSITYAGKQFIKTADATDNDPRGLVKGTQIYAYVEPTDSSSSRPTQKAHLIYFAPGTDPTTATTATYVTYDYTPPGTYSNASSALSITIDPQNAGTTTNTTSCALEGIGWIVCPITNFLAGAMDKLFDVLSGFLTVRPIQTSQDNALFRIWSVMRNFANVVFVIGFLVIIYSQVTSVGLSNYGIKRMLPRLIITALLVNLSYWICAVAIDISNIAGNSLQELFVSLREVLVANETNSWNIGWQSVAGFILSGGTAAVLTGIGAHALLGGTITGSIFLLVPILVTVLVAVLVAVLVMALRQALITVLVIISPLAFAAYLLPNTEKYSEKARELFTTMLFVYPALSVVFGGSQLAGLAIIQNADSINVILLGMAVQVAPLIVTPLLIKFSGALLSRFAGMVNNPKKGLIDRTRNWAQDRAANQKAYVLGQPAKPGWRGAVTRRSQNIDAKRRKREALRSANEGLAEGRWLNSKEYSDVQQIAMRAAAAKELGETSAQHRYEASKYNNASIQELDIGVRNAKLKLEGAKTTVEANWEEMRAGSDVSLLHLTPSQVAARGISNYQNYRASMIKSIQDGVLEEGIQKRRIHSAEHVRQKEFTKLMLSRDDLRQRAGGIDPHGADAALASAVAEDRTAFGKSVEEAKHVLKHFNVSADGREKLLDGETIHAKDSSGHVRTFSLADTFATEAAIEIQMKEGSFGQKQKIIAESGEGRRLYAHRTTIGDEAAANKIGEQAAYLGGAAINMIKQGEIKGAEGLDIAAAYSIVSGKLRAEHLATMDHDAVKRILRVAQTGDPGIKPEDVAKFHANIPRLGTLAQEALTNANLRGRVAENALEALKDMQRIWPPAGGD